MKRIIFALLTVAFSISGQAQQVVDLQENSNYKYNGLEYGYSITNEQSKEVKGDDYDRYEISLFVTNSSGCTRIIPFREGITSTQSDNTLIAEFTCRNATGKRLTAKGGKLEAKPWYSRVKINEESSSGKYRFVTAQVGYAIGNGQTINNRIIVIVPKGERPKISCRAIYLQEY